MVSFLVGIRIRYWILLILGLIFWRVGMMKVVVLLVLFLVCVRILCLVSVIGMFFFWMGEGFLKLVLKMFISKDCLSLKFLNFMFLVLVIFCVIKEC